MANRLTDTEKATIVKEGKGFLVTKAITEEPNLGNQLNSFVTQYLIPTRGKDKATAMYDIYRADPTIVPEMVSMAHTQHESELVAKVKGREGTVAMGITEGHAIEIAEKYIGDEIYWAIKEELEKGDTGNIKPIFATKYETGDALWTATVATATYEAVRDAAKKDVTRTRTRELHGNIYTEQNENFKYNSAKFAGFTTKMIRASQSDDTKNTIRRDIGVGYTKTKITQNKPQSTN